MQALALLSSWVPWSNQAKVQHDREWIATVYVQLSSLRVRNHLTLSQKHHQFQSSLPRRSSSLRDGERGSWLLVVSKRVQRVVVNSQGRASRVSKHASK